MASIGSTRRRNNTSMLYISLLCFSIFAVVVFFYGNCSVVIFSFFGFCHVIKSVSVILSNIRWEIKSLTVVLVVV